MAVFVLLATEKVIDLFYPSDTIYFPATGPNMGAGNGFLPWHPAFTWKHVGLGQVRLLIGQVDLHKVFFLILYNVIKICRNVELRQIKVFGYVESFSWLFALHYLNQCLMVWYVYPKKYAHSLHFVVFWCLVSADFYHYFSGLFCSLFN